MINKVDAKQILTTSLQTGGDFADLFIEDTIENTIEFSNGEVSNVNTSNVYGAGLRILNRDEELYGYTNDLSTSGLTQFATSLSQSFAYDKKEICFDFDEMKRYDDHPSLR